MLTVLLSLLWTLQLPLPKMVEIPGGRSYMGTLNPSVENRDETYREVCLPAFLMSETEITNAQYEAFDPAHKALRGYKGFSNNDDEAVVMVSWEDAQAYCRWLSNRTGRHFRLPRAKRKLHPAFPRTSESLLPGSGQPAAGRDPLPVPHRDGRCRTQQGGRAERPSGVSPRRSPAGLHNPPGKTRSA